MRESTVEAWLKRRVEATGGMTRKTQWVGRWGCPDRWCGWPSTKRTAWVELKGDGGRLSVHQEHEMNKLQACGEKVVMLSSIEEVDAFIEEMLRQTIPMKTVYYCECGEDHDINHPHTREYLLHRRPNEFGAA